MYLIIIENKVLELTLYEDNDIDSGLCFWSYQSKNTDKIMLVIADKTC